MAMGRSNGWVIGRGKDRFDGCFTEANVGEAVPLLTAVVAINGSGCRVERTRNGLARVIGATRNVVGRSSQAIDGNDRELLVQHVPKLGEADEGAIHMSDASCAGSQLRIG